VYTIYAYNHRAVLDVHDFERICGDFLIFPDIITRQVMFKVFDEFAYQLEAQEYQQSLSPKAKQKKMFEGINSSPKDKMAPKVKVPSLGEDKYAGKPVLD
jgi:hypothetical protein